MFAVLKTGGKQYTVRAGDVLRVEKLAAEAGQMVRFDTILMLGGDTPTVGSPLVAGAAVTATVIDQIKGEKTIHYVKRRRKHSSQRTKGHRQHWTLVRIADILASGAETSDVALAVGTAAARRAAHGTTPVAAPVEKPKRAAKPKAEAPKAAVAEVEVAPVEAVAADAAPAKPKRAAKKPAAAAKE